MTDRRQEIAEKIGTKINKIEKLTVEAMADANDKDKLTYQLLKRALNEVKEAHLSYWAACRAAGLNEGGK